MMLCLSYSIGYTVRGYSKYEIVCDCDTLAPMRVIENINEELLGDNIRLKNELYIALDYINYTNMGTTHYYLNRGSSMNDDTLSFYNIFIIDFYEMKAKLYRSVMDLIESKQLLYKQYTELQNRCNRY